MFLRIFRYRVKPQMRDRHLAAQARAARLYEQHVRHSPKYFRRSGDPNSWVELHWYEDKAECQRVAAAVADDPELAGLWRDFQETLDGDYPATLEEFAEYELPRPVNSSPFSQPPIDAQETPAPAPSPPRAEAASLAAAKSTPVAAELADEAASESAPPTSQESRQASPRVESSAHSADNGEAQRRDETAGNAEEPTESTPSTQNDEDGPTQRSMWPRPPLATDNAADDLFVKDDQSDEARRDNSLSFNDGVWIVEPENKPRHPRGDDH